MRLFRWLFWFVAMIAIVWFGATVQLGRRTLFGHLAAIARTPEAKEFAAGTTEEAGKLAGRVRREVRADGGGPAKPPSEQINDRDREALDKLIKEKRP